MRKKALAAPVVLLLSACTMTRGVTRESLANLDGYRAEEARQSRAAAGIDGKPVEFGQGSTLRLVKHDGKSFQGEFRAIDVRESVFSGVMSSNREVSFSLDELKTAEITTCARCDSTIAATAGVVVIALLGVLTYHAVKNSIPSSQ